MRTNSNLVVVTGAGVSAGDVEIQGSLDGTNWYVIGPRSGRQRRVNGLPPDGHCSG